MFYTFAFILPQKDQLWFLLLLRTSAPEVCQKQIFARKCKLLSPQESDKGWEIGWHMKDMYHIYNCVKRLQCKFLIYFRCNSLSKLVYRLFGSNCKIWTFKVILYKLKFGMSKIYIVLHNFASMSNWVAQIRTFGHCPFLQCGAVQFLYSQQFGL